MQNWPMVDSFLHLLPSAVSFFLSDFPGLFFSVAHRGGSVPFTSLQLRRRTRQALVNGIKTAEMLSAAYKEMLCLGFWCSHMQDVFLCRM